MPADRQRGRCECNLHPAVHNVACQLSQTCSRMNAGMEMGNAPEPLPATRRQTHFTLSLHVQMVLRLVMKNAYMRPQASQQHRHQDQPIDAFGHLNLASLPGTMWNGSLTAKNSIVATGMIALRTSPTLAFGECHSQDIRRSVWLSLTPL